MDDIFGVAVKFEMVKVNITKINHLRQYCAGSLMSARGHVLASVPQSSTHAVPLIPTGRGMNRDLRRNTFRCIRSRRRRTKTVRARFGSRKEH
jgi:hypothetical protein